MDNLVSRRRIIYGLLGVGLLVLGALGLYRYYGAGIGADPIQTYVPARDRVDLEKIFAQNWYWLINIPYKEALVSFGEDLDKVESVTERQKPDALQWLVYRENDIVKGFCAYFIKKPALGKILFLAVDEKYRGHGIAQQLIQRAISALERAGSKTIEIVVRVENFRAQNLYRKVGFEAVKTDETFMFMERYGG